MSSSSKTIITSVKGRVMDGDGNLNKFGNIDGARIQDYDHDTQTVKLRIDDSNVPGFWMEINIRFDEMAKWVEKMKEESKEENEEIVNNEQIENKEAKEETESKEETEQIESKSENKGEKDEPTVPPRLRESCTGYNCTCWKYGIYKFCADPRFNTCMVCYNRQCIRSKKGHQEKCDAGLRPRATLSKSSQTLKSGLKCGFASPRDAKIRS